MNFDYWNECEAAVTVCDNEGVVLYCNNRSAEQFAKYGDLIGTNLKNCHSTKSWQMMCDMLVNDKTNTYTIEKNGIKKIIRQMPWKVDGEVKGLIEISFEIPSDMPHHVRD